MSSETCYHKNLTRGETVYYGNLFGHQVEAYPFDFDFRKRAASAAQYGKTRGMGAIHERPQRAAEAVEKTDLIHFISQGEAPFQLQSRYCSDPSRGMRARFFKLENHRNFSSQEKTFQS